MHKIPILFVFLITAINAYDQDKKIVSQDHILNKALKQIRNDKDLKNASIGFFAVDVKTGETIAELNPDLSLMPASTQKIITTATALEVLGKKFRFTTKLQYSGKIDTLKKILHGDIYIKGGADPTLGSEHFDKSKDYFFIKNWIEDIKNSKIDSIDGCIIADASEYGTEITPPKWSWEDVGNYYGSGANGLTVFDNSYKIHFISPQIAGSLTTITKVEPEIPGLIICNEVISSDTKTDEAFVFGAPYNYLQIIRGNIPKGKSDFIIKGAIPDPAYFLAWTLNSELNRTGIGVKLKPTTNRLLNLKGDSIISLRTELDSCFSPGISNIIEVTNKKSINLFAEHLFNEIARELKNNWSNSQAITAIKDFWQVKGMDIDGFYIFDGSGLSRYNAVTSRQMVFILNYMANKSKYYNEFLKSLPVAGESGTLKSVGSNTSAKGKVIAKSGSIGRVRSYSGYVSTKSGRMLAFSMNLSNYNCSDSEARGKLTDLMVSMADFDL